MEDCIFCKIANHQISPQALYEDESVIAFNDVNPAAPVHVLVIPKRHIPGVMSLAEGDKSLVGHIVLVLKNIAQELGISEDGFRIVINSGPQAGQSVPHLHFHLLGGRAMDWPPG